MRIWVDADACPRAIKDILYRAANRCRVELTLVANRALAAPRSPYIRSIVVPAGFDAADDEIVKRVDPGDLVISSDLPLAAQLIAKGARVLSQRGEWISEANIGPLLSVRNFMTSLREAGVDTGGAAPLGAGDKQAFAAHLDRFLAGRA
jgi:uncharacterized protein YaiI (UPF0178 family)